MRRVRTKIGKETRLTLYVGLGIRMQDLKTLGKKFSFRTERERAAFNNALKFSKPLDMADIEAIYNYVSRQKDTKDLTWTIPIQIVTDRKHPIICADKCSFLYFDEGNFKDGSLRCDLRCRLFNVRLHEDPGLEMCHRCADCIKMTQQGEK